MTQLYGKAWPAAQYPTKVWDGTSPTRADPNIFRPPDQGDLDQIAAEIMALESANFVNPWINEVLQTGWTNGSNAPASHRVVNSRVYFRGVILPGTKTDGTLLFTLANSRPITKLTFPVVSSGVDTCDPASRIVVDTDGTVKIYGVSTATSLSLSNISYFVDQ